MTTVLLRSTRLTHFAASVRHCRLSVTLTSLDVNFNSSSALLRHFSTRNPRSKSSLDPDSIARRQLNEKFEFVDWGKKNVTLAIGYLGTNYRGLQFLNSKERRPQDLSKESPPHQAVANVVHTALKNAGLILPSNHDIKRINLCQSSRTDKGVHASLLLLSARLLVVPPTLDMRGTNTCCFLPDVVDRINEHLPEDVRVFTCSTNTKSFNAQSAAAWRHYSYFIPVHGRKSEDASGEKYYYDYGGQQREIDLDKLREVLGLYEGTHNYTQLSRRAALKQGRKRYKNAALLEKQIASRGIRHVLSCSVTPMQSIPKATGDGSGQQSLPQLLCVDIIGDSFVYNQIRYMIGGALAVATGTLSASMIELSLLNRDILKDVQTMEKSPLSPVVAEDKEQLREYVKHLVDDPDSFGNDSLSNDDVQAVASEVEPEYSLKPFRLPLAPPNFLVARSLGFTVRSHTYLMMPSSAPSPKSLWKDDSVTSGSEDEDSDSSTKAVAERSGYQYRVSDADEAMQRHVAKYVAPDHHHYHHRHHHHHHCPHHHHHHQQLLLQLALLAWPSDFYNFCPVSHYFLYPTSRLLDNCVWFDDTAESLTDARRDPHMHRNRSRQIQNEGFAVLDAKGLQAMRVSYTFVIVVLLQCPARYFQCQWQWQC